MAGSAEVGDHVGPWVRSRSEDAQDMLMSVVEIYERKREHSSTSRWKSKETFHPAKTMTKFILFVPFAKKEAKTLRRGLVWTALMALPASRSAARVVARHCCMTDQAQLFSAPELKSHCLNIFSCNV